MLTWLAIVGTRLIACALLGVVIVITGTESALLTRLIATLLTVLVVVATLLVTTSVAVVTGTVRTLLGSTAGALESSAEAFGAESGLFVGVAVGGVGTLGADTWPLWFPTCMIISLKIACRLVAFTACFVLLSICVLSLVLYIHVFVVL